MVVASLAKRGEGVGNRLENGSDGAFKGDSMATSMGIGVVFIKRVSVYIIIEECECSFD